MRIADRPTRRSRNRKAFLIGLGSLFDIQGEATYESLREMMPTPEPYNLNLTLLRANRNLRRASV